MPGTSASSEPANRGRTTSMRIVPSTPNPRLAEKFLTVWVMPVASPYESRDARFTASVLDGVSIMPSPAPEMTTGQSWVLKSSPVALRPHKKKPTAATVQPRVTGSLAPIRSRRRPPIWDATTKPKKKYRRYTPACWAGLPSEICAYSLATKNTGTKASIAMPSTRFSTANARIRKMRTWIRGTAVRSSTRTKATRRATPTTMHRTVEGLDHPQLDDCWKPSTLSATPPTTSESPRTSTFADLNSVTGFDTATSTSAIAATGRLTQKIARHVHSVR